MSCNYKIAFKPLTNKITGHFENLLKKIAFFGEYNVNNIYMCKSFG